jgi:hypothetical protein
LSHVVLLQKELEQQRAALLGMQQQLDHTSNRCACPAVLACMQSLSAHVLLQGWLPVCMHEALLHLRVCFPFLPAQTQAER